MTMELEEPAASILPRAASGTGGSRAAPIAKESRIGDIDIIRGMALFGVLMMNLALAFRVPFFGNRPPTDLPLLERIVFRVELIVLSGKAMTLFSILFGVGLAIFLERASARGSGAMWLLLRRVLFLTAFGVAHAFLVWHGDILMSYSATALIALFFLRRRSAVLLAALGVCLVWPLARALWPALFEFTNDSAPGHYDEAFRIYSAGSYLDVVRFRVHEILHLEFPSYVFLLPDELTRMLIGILLWRSGILQLATRERYRRALLWVASVGILAGVGYGGYRWIYFELYHPPPGPPSMLRMMIMLNTTLLCALGYGAGLLLLLRQAKWRERLGVFAPLGRMAFTNYLTQSIVFSTVFYGYGFGLLGKVGYGGVALMGIALYVLQTIASAIWLRHFLFGPFEWAWRSLTYGQLQPFRRIASPA